MKILIADGQALLRQGLRVVLAGLDDDVEIVEAENIFDLFARTKDEPGYELMIVDMMLAELAMGDGIAGLCRCVPDSQVVILSDSEDPGAMKSAITSGARGYVLKSTQPTALIHALRLVLSGEAYVPPAVLNRIDDEPSDTEAGDGETSAIRKLTPREREIVDQLVEGRSNKQIAKELEINEGTVKVHLKAVLRKLGVSNRTQAAMLAVRSTLPGQTLTAG